MHPGYIVLSNHNILLCNWAQCDAEYLPVDKKYIIPFDFVDFWRKFEFQCTSISSGFKFPNFSFGFLNVHQTGLILTSSGMQHQQEIPDLQCNSIEMTRAFTC